MVNFSNEDQDTSKATMEASTERTIDFLQLLLSTERSVSKTARQRADELAKRVAELEEHLKIVMLERKRAEKATADVLSIFENNGISDSSEAIDSGSEQEPTVCESKLINNSRRREKTLVGKKLRRNDTEEFLGNDLESPSLTCRSLSWKSEKISPHSLEKRKYVDSTRSSSFVSLASSSTEHLDKSFRQIQNLETRNGVRKHSDSLSHSYDCGTGTLREDSENNEPNALTEDQGSGTLVNEREVDGHSFNEHGGDKDIERALKHQAQLTGQCEAEEKTQREWEERFREYNTCTPDSCDLGNHSDVTEERDEIKAPAPPCSTEAVASQNCKLKVDAGEAHVSKEYKNFGDLQLNHLPQNVDMRCLKDQTSANMGTQASSASKFAFSVPKEKHGQEHAENHSHHDPSHSAQHHARPHYDPASHSVAISSSFVGNGLNKVEASESRNELSLVPDKVGSVLEGLQHAKLSLKQKLYTLTSVQSGSVGNAIGPYIPPIRTKDNLCIPVDYAGLFRLPTDLQFINGNQSSILRPGHKLSLTNYSGENVGDKILFSPDIKSSRLKASMVDCFLTAPIGHYIEARAGISTRTPVFEPNWPAGVSSSSRYSYASSSSSTVVPPFGENTRSNYPLSQDHMAQMPSIGLSRTLPKREVGLLPPVTPFHFYENHINPNMNM